MQQIRESFWRFFGPFFIAVRDLLMKVGLMHHHGRQEYHLGWLKAGMSVQDLDHLLASLGFKNHAAAWIDDDEILALRKLDGFRFQYHLRVYKDGEVKGHYEVTPEAGFWNHFLEWEMEPRRDEFLQMAGKFIEAR